MGGVVVGVDRSETARRAATRGAELAIALGEPLHLVTALRHGESRTVQVGTDQFRHDWVANEAEFLDGMKLELGVDDTTTFVGDGDPAQSLCEQAERLGARLIVVGNRRVQGAKRLLGSIAADVARRAPCDVLVAHTVEG